MCQTILQSKVIRQMDVCAQKPRAGKTRIKIETKSTKALENCISEVLPVVGFICKLFYYFYYFAPMFSFPMVSLDLSYVVPGKLENDMNALNYFRNLSTRKNPPTRYF